MKKIISFVTLILFVTCLSGCGSDNIVISFDSNGGTNVDSVILLKNEALVLPDAPVKEGYVFNAWKDQDGKVVGDKQFFSKDTKLIADWSRDLNKVMISFDSNGGNQIDTIFADKGEVINMPLDPEKEGYLFVAWKDKNGNLYSISGSFSEDTDLYASWQKE